MRFFFATDIHGSDLCFKKFLRAPDFYDVDALFLGGDYSSKSLVACARVRNGWQATIGQEIFHLRTRSEFEVFQTTWANRGHLIAEIDYDQTEAFQTNSEFREQLFAIAQRRRLTRWTEMATAALEAKDVPIYHVPGNDEPLYCDDFFNDSPFVAVHRRHIQINDNLTVLGLGGSNPTPWHTAREYDETEIEEFIQSSFSESLNVLPMIFFGHVPPFKSGLDDAPALNPDLSYKLVLGSHKKEPVGSIAVRAAIQRLQPIIGLFGHVHESRGEARIGRTVCVNPGSAYYNGRLQGCVVTIRDERVSVQFTEG